MPDMDGGMLLSECKVGEFVNWVHTARGGYGFVSLVPGVIVRVTAKSVTIAVRACTGSVVERRVMAGNLRKVTRLKSVHMCDSIAESLAPRLHLVPAGSSAGNAAGGEA